MKKERIISLLIIAIITIIAVILVIFRNNEINLDIKSIIISIAISVVLVFYLSGQMRDIRERKHGIPTEDEMSKRQKEIAGNKAFKNSLWIWLGLFYLKSYIENTSTLLGIGILSSALLYGIYLWILKYKGTRDE
ncbi:MAG: hypothetical protein QNK33_09845 [Bacteroidales bacterium]|nr:hypothetical protein [Bacteroidales bacterium]